MATDNTFQYPLSVPWDATRGFNKWIDNWDGNGHSGYHLGVDVPAEALVTEVKAASEGDVIFADSVKGYGSVVIIKHPNNDVTTVYGHLSASKGLTVKKDNHVTKETVIGYIGTKAENGGWGPHLHFGVRKGKDPVTKNICGKWPYIGYTISPCKKFTPEEQVNMWYEPSEFILDHMPPSLTLASPNGGEIWHIGSIQNIKWAYTGNIGSTVKLELIDSLTSSSTPYLITASTPIGGSEQGSYPWAITSDPWLNPTSGNYLIRITSNEKPEFSDTSDSHFTIESSGEIIVEGDNPTNENIGKNLA